MSTIGIAICTHGTSDWADLARTRAYPSTERQMADEVLLVHSQYATLAQVRNQALSTMWTEHVILLDADDELAPGYVNAMRRALRAQDDGFIKLFAPRVQYVDRETGVADDPVFPNRHAPMDTLNHCVIGTMFQNHLPRFRELDAYEDWDFFLQHCSYSIDSSNCIVDVPDAIYLASKSNGRNSQPRHVLNKAYQQIRESHNLKFADVA